MIGTLRFHSVLHTLPTFGAPPLRWGLLNPHQHSSIIFSVILISRDKLRFLCSTFSGSYYLSSSDYIIFPSKLHFASQLANISLHLCQITQIEPKDVRTQFRLFAAYELLPHTTSISSFFVPLMNCVFLFSSAMTTGEMWLITLTPCSIDFI